MRGSTTSTSLAAHRLCSAGLLPRSLTATCGRQCSPTRPTGHVISTQNDLTRQGTQLFAGRSVAPVIGARGSECRECPLGFPLSDRCPSLPWLFWRLPAPPRACKVARSLFRRAWAGPVVAPPSHGEVGRPAWRGKGQQVKTGAGNRWNNDAHMSGRSTTDGATAVQCGSLKCSTCPPFSSFCVLPRRGYLLCQSRSTFLSISECLATDHIGTSCLQEVSTTWADQESGAEAL